MTDWLLNSWYDLLPRHIAMPVLTLAAGLFGALVGVEREIKEKPAGVRTLSLVSIGACIFTMVSALVAGDTADPGRIAAQVVSGIGFLGAGAILRSPLGVVGMTTAATIWVAAAIGMVVGAGHVGAGLGLSTLVLILLNGVSRIERIYQGACDFTTATVLYEPVGGKTVIRILDLLDEYRLKGLRTANEAQIPGLEELELRYCKAHAAHREVLNRLAGMREIREIHTTLGVPGSRALP
jgi:putative Mg2+ transporter-C (MgtC) family protein